MIRITLLCCLGLHGLAGQDESDRRPAELSLPQAFVVEAGERDRLDVPVSAPLPAIPEDPRMVRLVETTNGGDAAVPAQFEPGQPPRLWWLLNGRTPAGSQRTFRLGPGTATAGTEVVVDRQSQFLEVRQGTRARLRYNMAHVEPPPGADLRYGRSAHIHPVWTPRGALVTDQFPPDHLHQSGVFLAYTRCEFEGRDPNFWDVQGGKGRVRFKNLKATVAGPVFAEFRVEHEHVDLTVPEGKVALNETWDARVWNGGAESCYWICDLTSTLECATDSPVRLLKHHYGGMALRGARAWDPMRARFETSEGLDRLAGNHTRPKWCDLSGPVDGQAAGIALMTHPGNFRFPEPLRIHPEMPYMVYCPAHLDDWEIVPGRPHVSRYRFVIHDGPLPAEAAERLWAEFAEPLVAASNHEPQR